MKDKTSQRSGELYRLNSFRTLHFLRKAFHFSNVVRFLSP
ncbi:hypothetical protein LEP1GSC137_2435 [Leptospira borgpetersenii str. Noumea 25]|nr:hypothetical protein LEP1GSC121_2201 [Leptospira borgpetersenii serovar Castellonis str. 200801910]EMO09332.1 hypothetical protein LEP1GSC137_2435 [Leptospira borgpetersenii str. Noumea 25]